MKYLEIFIPLIFSVASGETTPNYNVTYFDRSPGLYYEDIGTVKVYNDNWKLITYLDFEQFKHRFNDLEAQFSEVKLHCAAHKFIYVNYACDNAIGAMANAINMIEEKQLELQDLLGRGARVKRSWFDFIGKGFKILFGTLDREDASYYNSKIDAFVESEEKFGDLFKEQTYIVGSIIGLIDHTVGNVESNYENIINVTEILIEFMHSNKETHNKTKEELIYISHIESVRNALDQYNVDIFNLIRAVMDANIGIMNPSILTPVNLMKELQTLNIPVGLSFPVPLQPENSEVLLKLVKIDIYYKDSKLVYVIKVPLLEQCEFTLYKISSVPVHISTNKFLIVHPTAKYLIASSNKQKYILLSEDEFKKCTKLSHYICKQNQPMFMKKEICEVALLNKVEAIPKSCDVKFAEMEHNLWLKTARPNSWIFVILNSDLLTVTCDNSKAVDVQLKNAGVITLDENCKGYSSSVLLTTQRTYSSNFSKIFMNSYNEI